MVAGFWGILGFKVQASGGSGGLGVSRCFQTWFKQSSLDFGAFAAFRPRAVVQHGTCLCALEDAGPLGTFQPGSRTQPRSVPTRQVPLPCTVHNQSPRL